MPGRTGAEDSDDRGAPVGTVRVAGLGADSEAWLSDKVDCAESGREGIAFLRAAMASLRADRPPGLFAVLEVAETLEPLGLDGSFSNRLRDFASRSDMILP